MNCKHLARQKWKAFLKISYELSRSVSIMQDDFLYEKNDVLVEEMMISILFCFRTPECGLTVKRGVKAKHLSILNVIGETEIISMLSCFRTLEM